jgi:starch phosphorylase
MKLALNGSLTIGTLDGANVEIHEEVGDDNIFIFGNTVEQVNSLLAKGYNPTDFYNANAELRAVIDWLGSDYFTPDEGAHVLAPLRDNLLYHDPFLCLADFQAYCDAQDKVSEAYLDKTRWAKMAILNTARVGKFSSDRTISEYAKDIWKLKPVRIK